MLVTQSNQWGGSYRKRTINREVKLGPVSLKFVTIALIAIAALFYLSQSTQASTLKYQIMDLKDKESKAQQDVDQLEVESARLKSLSTIQEGAPKYNLQP